MKLPDFLSQLSQPRLVPAAGDSFVLPLMTAASVASVTSGEPRLVVWLTVGSTATLLASRLLKFALDLNGLGRAVRSKNAEQDEALQDLTQWAQKQGYKPPERRNE